MRSKGKRMMDNGRQRRSNRSSKGSIYREENSYDMQYSDAIQNSQTDDIQYKIVRKDKKTKKGLKAFSKIIIVGIFLVAVGFVINIAPNYIQNKLAKKTNIIINNNNVTSSLKKEVKIDDKDVIYISFEDIKNFFDENIYFDKQYNQIITSGYTKLASLELGQKQMYVNSSKVNIYAIIIEEDDTYYLPFSEMKDVYNVDIKYSKDDNIVTIDSLNREQKMGNSSKNAGVKYKPTMFSKTIDKVKKGDSVVVIDKEDGWYKVRTSDGNIGYLKDVTNIYTSRKTLEKEKQIDENISLVWDSYYSGVAPTRKGSIEGINVISPSMATLKKLGKGELSVTTESSMKAYVEWAHSNGYKVWPMIANAGQQETTSEILNDYKLREALINRILEMVVKYELDGINIDFEYIKMADKDLFTRFIIELAPRLAELDKALSVDVTAPDGSEDWSMSYDRHKIGQVADYVVFMAYDEYGLASTKEGTTAGADWIEVNLKKFVGTQEDVESSKIILGMPFYTRLWKINGSKVTSDVVSIKNVNSSIPASAQKTWNDDVKQYYVEYQSGGVTYKMWIEDEESLKAKFDLMRKYKLAGAAYWQKDFESPTTWQMIKEEIQK